MFSQSFLGVLLMHFPRNCQTRHRFRSGFRITVWLQA